MSKFVSTRKLLESFTKEKDYVSFTLNNKYGKHVYEYVKAALKTLDLSIKDVECMHLWAVPHMQVERLRELLETPKELIHNKRELCISSMEMEVALGMYDFCDITNKHHIYEYLTPVEGTIWLTDSNRWIVWDIEGITLVERPEIPNIVTDDPVICPFCGSTEIIRKPLNDIRGSHVYICQPCPGVFFPYYDSDDVDLLRNKLN